MARRIPKRKSEISWMSDQAFEDEASLLLAEYGNIHGYVSEPPIPIDDIVEEHFKIAVEYRDLRKEFPEWDVHGAIYVNSKKIAVDQRLVPEANPSMLGRYRFTLAHELAHWRLHRHLYMHRANEPTLLQNGNIRPDHIFRSNSSDPKEVQANRLAACILMPREMIKRMWHQVHDSMDPIFLDDLRPKQQQILAAEVRFRGNFKDGKDAIDNMLLEHIARPLADRFEVSPDAMRIRLETISLLQRKKEPSLFA